VEAPTEHLAHALIKRLSAYPTELRDSSEGFAVRVSLVGKVDRSIVDVLDGVDGWLVENALGSVRVHLDDRVYTLTPPVAAER
jgi:hypothetical protein